jgi:hypothetical protein
MNEDEEEKEMEENLLPSRRPTAAQAERAININ